MNIDLLQKTLSIAAQVKDPTTAAVFASVVAGAAFWIAFRKRDKAVVLSIGIVLALGILFLGALPLLAKAYLASHGVYEIRVITLGPDGSPLENATVVCSPGGEQKSIVGGYECDLPPRNRPADGLFTVYASVKSAFLSGQNRMRLGDDYNPVLTVQLQPDRSAKIQGEIQNSGGHVMEGVWVSVIGYEGERTSTDAGGGFSLLAHAANGQMVKIHVEAKGYNPYEGLQQAGDTSITILLQRNRDQQSP
jgi:hypothetical protein